MTYGPPEFGKQSVHFPHPKDTQPPGNLLEGGTRWQWCDRAMRTMRVGESVGLLGCGSVQERLDAAVRGG